MTALLGKRKRRTSIDVKREIDVTSSDQDRYNKVLRKHFESTYIPLENPQAGGPGDGASDVEAVSEESNDWEGLSGSEGEKEDGTTVEVIDYSVGRDEDDEELEKDERKAFMSTKIPKQNPLNRTSSKEAPEEDAESEAALRKNDAALQRLLRESHLLGENTASPNFSLTLTGGQRHRAMDAQLQNLGSKVSTYSQKRMPLSHRQGMLRKASMKDQSRRAQARDSGIVLEKKAGAGTARSKGKRERTVGAPAVGKFKGGMLKLSAKDVRDIQGPDTRRATKGKKGRK